MSMYPAMDDDFDLAAKPPASLGRSGDGSGYVVHIADQPASVPAHHTVNVVEEDDGFSPARSCCFATKLCLVGWAVLLVIFAVVLLGTGGAISQGLKSAMLNYEPNEDMIDVVVPWQENYTSREVTLLPGQVAYFALDVQSAAVNVTSDVRTLRLCVDADSPVVSAYAQVGFLPALDDDDYYFSSSQDSWSAFYNSQPDNYLEAIELPPCSRVPLEEEEGIDLCTDDATVYVTVVSEFADDAQPRVVSLGMRYDECSEGACNCVYRAAAVSLVVVVFVSFLVLACMACAAACLCCTCCCIVHAGDRKRAAQKKYHYDF